MIGVEVHSDIELCRITIVAPKTRMDLALPVDASLADLLPTLLKHAGEDPQDPGFLRGGWVLQRLGEAPLDAGRRLSALGVRDGETLHLRHRDSALPELAFDDVADAMATVTGHRRALWGLPETKVGAVASATVLGLLAVAILAVAGPAWTLPGVLLLGMAAVLAGAAVSLSRAYDSPASAVASVAVGAVAGLAGGAAAMAPTDATSVLGSGSPGLLVGAAAALLVCVIGVLAVGRGRDAFLGATLALLVVVIAAGVTTLGLAEPRTVSGGTVAVLMAVAALLPGLSARIARLPLPPIPTSAEDLRRAEDMLPGEHVVDQALAADRTFTALTASTATLVTACLVLAVRDDPAWYARALAVAVAVALLLRARHLTGRTQRVWLLVTAAADLALAAWGFVRAMELPPLVVVPLVLFVAAGAAIWWGVRMAGRRLTPYWGRAGDVIEVLVLLAVIPLALGVAGVYGTVQGLFG